MEVRPEAMARAAGTLSEASAVSGGVVRGVFSLLFTWGICVECELCCVLIRGRLGCEAGADWGAVWCMELRIGV